MDLEFIFLLRMFVYYVLLLRVACTCIFMAWWEVLLWMGWMALGILFKRGAGGVGGGACV